MCLVCRDSETKGSNKVPLRDQQTALSLLLELAIQRGSLSHLLRAVLLLLNLWTGAHHDCDNRLNASLMSAPIVPYLRRIQNIPSKKHVQMSKWDEVKETRCLGILKCS